MGTISRPILHLLGASAAILLLVVGAAAAFHPALQALSAVSETEQIAQINGLQQEKIDSLGAQSDQMEELNAAVETLRSQIPAATRASDIPALIAAAAQASGVTPTLLETGVIEPFAPRDADAVAGSADADESSTADATESSEADATDTSDPDSASATRLQQSLRVGFTAPDGRAAAAFVDELRQGVRAIAIDTVQVDRAGDGVTGSVSLLIFADTTGADAP